MPTHLAVLQVALELPFVPCAERPGPNRLRKITSRAKGNKTRGLLVCGHRCCVLCVGVVVVAVSGGADDVGGDCGGGGGAVAAAVIGGDVVGVGCSGDVVGFVIAVALSVVVAAAVAGIITVLVRRCC